MSQSFMVGILNVCAKATLTKSLRFIASTPPATSPPQPSHRLAGNTASP